MKEEQAQFLNKYQEVALVANPSRLGLYLGGIPTKSITPTTGMRIQVCSKGRCFMRRVGPVLRNDEVWGVPCVWAPGDQTWRVEAADRMAAAALGPVGVAAARALRKTWVEIPRCTRVLACERHLHRQLALQRYRPGQLCPTQEGSRAQVSILELQGPQVTLYRLQGAPGQLSRQLPRGPRSGLYTALKGPRSA